MLAQKRLAAIHVLCVLLTIAYWPQSAQADNAYRDTLPNWAFVLNTFVDTQGRTDFKALSQSTQGMRHLRAFTDAIGEVSPTANPELFAQRNEVLSYHINAYNALAMLGVIERDIPDGFTSFVSRASFFRFRNVRIGGKSTNLYDYENKVIRPLDEPRAHFALNCMVRDCPRLPQKVFTAELLDEQLELLTREFFSKERHLRIDTENKTAHVSSILKFYTEDFVASGKKNDLPQYINQYLDAPIPSDFKVKFIAYDWRINQQPEMDNRTAT